jgi:hypothetical protein
MTKDDYHQYILNQLAKQDQLFDTEKLQIWLNPNVNSFRLTNTGHYLFNTFSELPQHHLKLKLYKNMTLSNVLALDRAFSTPFFYHVEPKISCLDICMFGDSQEIFWMSLYNDLECFLKNYRKNT